MITILIATGNSHKIYEYKQLLKHKDINIISFADLNVKDDPDENGLTYKENSYIKAKSAQKFTNFYVLADDSGLEVSCMDNKPGIHTARFAKENGGNEKANNLVIDIVKKHENKEANFICLICLISPDNKTDYFEGICKGCILDKIHGTNGFGYDPIFYSTEANTPFGEAKEDIKNKYSHRGLACAKLLKYLKDSKLIS